MTKLEFGLILCLFDKHKLPMQKDPNWRGFPSESYCVRCKKILGFNGKPCKFYYNGKRIKYAK